MSALERIRAQQEVLAQACERLSGDAWRDAHQRWLRLQRRALGILRGERCEAHGFEDCAICRPAGPTRPER